MFTPTKLPEKNVAAIGLVRSLAKAVRAFINVRKIVLNPAYDKQRGCDLICLLLFSSRSNSVCVLRGKEAFVVQGDYV